MEQVIMMLPKYLKSPLNFLSGITSNSPESAIPYYEDLGITFKEYQDELEITAILPEGWTREGTGYWTTVYDEKKRARFTFFEKSAIYDRDAFTHKKRRYTCDRDFTGDHKDGYRVIKHFVVDADGTVLFKCRAVKIKDESGSKDEEVSDRFWHKYYGAIKRQEIKCEAYLNENYPDWKNPDAYWDKE